MSTALTGLERVFRVREVSHHLDTADDVVYRMISDGRLRSVRVGRLLRVPESALAEFLAGHEPVSAD